MMTEHNNILHNALIHFTTKHKLNPKERRYKWRADSIP